MMLLEIAVGLLFADLWIVLLSGPALLVVHHLAVLPEEAYLSKEFGESYQRYRAAVRRYL
jgi:protein-S-isoprenylcysteine O-methyltransferase Ste14